MTTLALADDRLGMDGRYASGEIPLQTWLGGRWAILFSHPEDFVREQLESDRWLGVFSRGLSGHDVAAIALARAGRDTPEICLGPLAPVGGQFAAALRLDPPLRGVPTALSAAALRAAVDRFGPRFAMIIDANLRFRRVLTYHLPAELPSPLDLIGWAIALRKRNEADRMREDARSQSDFPVGADWRGKAGRSATHAGAGRSA